MVEKDEFLERRRIELAISSEFESYLRHAVRFARRIDPESICFSFRHAYDGVEKRCGNEK